MESRESKIRRMMDEKFIATHTCFLIVHAVGIPIKELKVYLNGNIHGTAIMDESPPNGRFIRLEPNEYTIVIRDFEVNKEDRRESNSIIFKALAAEKTVFIVTLENNALLLKKGVS